MNPTYIIDPEVPGGLGPRTLMDRSVHPPKVTYLHFVFDGWLGDHLVESFPCYLVSKVLSDSLIKEEISGFELADVEVETSEEFNELHPLEKLPPFGWLKIVGKSNSDDIFMTDDNRLAVTKKVLDIILATSPKGLDFREIGSDDTGKKVSVNDS